MTQITNVTNNMPAARIPTPSQNFAVVMAPHVTNNKHVISTYANDCSVSLSLVRKLLSLSVHFGF